MISRRRLEANLGMMSSFSDAGAGITRLAFSDADWQARGFIMDKMKEAGLTVREDAFGNVIGRRAGRKDALPPVMMGSHIDSVPNGGNFDGVVGVLGALEVICAMNDAGFENEHPIEFIVFMAEESSRFGMATIGSKAMTGQLTVDMLHEYKDKTGESLYAVLKNRALRPDDIMDAQITGPRKAFVELHIEQGKVLEQKNVGIGIVTGIAAPTRMQVTLKGQSDHSGTTIMGLRQDALCAAAEVILRVEALALDAKKLCVGTVGMLKVKPNVMNVIPGEVELGIDLRSIYDDEKERLCRGVKTAVQTIAYKRCIEASIAVLANDRPVELDQRMIKYLASVCDDKRVGYIKMPSGAGHDAMHMAKICPSGMLFIPCDGGVSHHENEYAEISDIVDGTRLLYEAVCGLTREDMTL